MQALSWFSPFQFSFFRIVLGAYLCIHFGMLIPYAADLFSDQGFLNDPSLNPTWGLFPNILYWLDSPVFVYGFVSVLAVISVLFILGYRRRLMSVLLWYGWVCLFNRNNLISNPGLPYVGWILLACALIPSGEPLSFGKRNEEWKMPPLIFWGAWIILAAGYTVSGIDKLNSESWTNGNALKYLLENPLARDTPLRTFLLGMPEWVLKSGSFLILAAEIIFLPLVIFSRTRFYAWILMVLMHLGILVVIDFADLTFGMLMIHFFTFDSRWLKPKKVRGDHPIVLFDGVCGLCNTFVNLMLREDRGGILRFSPLQGKTAAAKIPGLKQEQMDTVILYDNGKRYDRSSAALRTGMAIGGIWKLGAIFLLIPLFVRDSVYKIIAKNRYKWFGKHDECRIPTKEEREKFLD